MLLFPGLWTETGDGGTEGKIHAASAAGYDTNKKSNVRKEHCSALAPLA